MVQEACTYVEKTPNLVTKLKLIDTLRTVTAGKVNIYLDKKGDVENDWAKISNISQFYHKCKKNQNTLLFNVCVLYSKSVLSVWSIGTFISDLCRNRTRKTDHDISKDQRRSGKCKWGGHCVTGTAGKFGVIVLEHWNT